MNTLLESSSSCCRVSRGILQVFGRESTPAIGSLRHLPVRMMANTSTEQMANKNEIIISILCPTDYRLSTAEDSEGLTYRLVLHEGQLVSSIYRLDGASDLAKPPWHF